MNVRANWNKKLYKDEDIIKLRKIGRQKFTREFVEHREIIFVTLLFTNAYSIRICIGFL